MGELGWIDGRTVTIEYRWAEGRSERFAEIAAEFVQLKVDVIVTVGGAALAARQVTPTIPIVFAAATDPLGGGLVASLARPGGNATGLSMQASDAAGKRLELLRELLPGLRRLAVIGNVDYPATVQEIAEVRAAARTLGLDLDVLEIRRAEDIAGTFPVLKAGLQALYVCTSPLVNANHARINTLALGARVPTMHAVRDFLGAGGSCPMDRAPCIRSAAPPITSTRFCAGRSRTTCRSSSPPSSISSSTSRPPGRSTWSYRPRYSLAPTR